MVKYPHRLSFVLTELESEPYQDGNGDWIMPDPVATENIDQICRVEVSGVGNKSNKVANSDGVLVEFGYSVYMPKDAVEIPTNQEVLFFEGLTKIGEGTVKRFRRGQLGCQAWV